MIAIAQEYRQAEKNTPPDFTKNPPALRNSVFCQKAPKNAELNGLVQAQDPANDPELFFDPNGAKTVLRGSQANTAPFGGAAAPAPAYVASLITHLFHYSDIYDSPVPAPDTGATTPEQPAVTLPAEGEAECPTEAVVTITVTATNPAATNTNAVTISAGAPAPTAAPPVAAPPPAGVDFGSCETPEIEFGPAFDGRRETSFRPKAGGSFTQGSAQNINIVTRAMCDQLTNTCRANDAAKALCATAQQAAAAATPAKTGIQADAFNAVFGITTVSNCSAFVCVYLLTLGCRTLLPSPSSMTRVVLSATQAHPTPVLLPRLPPLRLPSLQPLPPLLLLPAETLVLVTLEAAPSPRFASPKVLMVARRLPLSLLTRLRLTMVQPRTSTLSLVCGYHRDFPNVS
jgi:hypothetical protein